MRNARIYLDQSVIGYVHEGRLDLQGMTGIDWVYSDQHFNEISRAGKTTYLSAFETLKAQHIGLQLDEKWRITDSAVLHPYSSPYERYDRYLRAINETPFDERIILDFLERLLGADNHQELSTVPERLRSQIQALLMQAGVLNEFHERALARVSDDLSDIIKNDLRERRSLEAIRKPLGVHNGRVGEPKTDNPIQEIFKLVSDKVSGISADQFFGFDPISKQGYDTWPMYLGVVGCHLVLNIVGYGTDRGIASGELPRSISDASHIATAAFCDAVISEDRRFCKKARAIYRYKSHPTQVLQLVMGKRFD